MTGDPVGRDITDALDLESQVRLAATACPGCGEIDVLRLVARLTVLDPPACYAVAGSGLKLAAREVPWVVCACGHAEQASERT